MLLRLINGAAKRKVNVDQAHLILASGKLVLQKQPEVKAWNILATDARTSDGKLLVPLTQKQDSILV